MEPSFVLQNLLQVYFKRTVYYASVPDLIAKT